ncbi:MAG TPA: FG-GAP-like repeat-containing protein, partial [Pirellulales bacterium]|nr:FG-GAP-like repeat-containing protein [Pirellulales bacterium]
TALLLLAAGIGYQFWTRTNLPDPGTVLYESFVETFQVGVAALDAGVTQVADEHLTRAIELVPQEPAAWADRGLLYLRSGRLPESGRDLEQAYKLAPDDPDVLKLVGLLEQRLGRYGESAAHLRQAVALDPNDVQAAWLLAQVIDQEQQEGSDLEYQRLMEQILALRPNNLHVLIEHLRVAVRRADAEAARGTYERLMELSTGWSAQARARWAGVEELLSGRLGPDAVPGLSIPGHVLKGEAGYAAQAEEVNPLNDQPGRSLQSFRRLARAGHAPAAPDEGLTFTSEPAPGSPDGPWVMALAVWLMSEGPPTIFLADNDELRRAGDEKVIAWLTAAPAALVAIDWNNDQRMDLLVAGPGGLQFQQQDEQGGFANLAAETGLTDDLLLHTDCRSALAADVDLDGDVDLVVARSDGPPLLLRNNFDGSWTRQPIFIELSGPQRFAWGDFDHDGAPDAAMLDSTGQLHVYANERSGRFVVWPAVPQGDRFLALAVADGNDDGTLDLVALHANGSIVCITSGVRRTGWDVVPLARRDDLKDTAAPPLHDLLHDALLLAADFDNNGALDLAASAHDRSAIWLGAGSGKFEPLPVSLPPRIAAAADFDGQGRLDLLALDDEGRAVRLRNRPSHDYHWQTVRPQATSGENSGDNRINSFGVGGEIELRAGTHVVKQPIASPVVHFGLGKRRRADVLRIVWPNGAFQAEFSTPIDKAVAAVQRLKGSCPFLFAWNGERFAFVTDFMWSTPLGMYINAADKGGLLQTTDWVKVGGDQLVAREGAYELRVQANLWETHFFDHLELVAVDHPADTELVVDERFFVDPAEPSLHLIEPPRSIAYAWDHERRDATDEVRSVDGVYLDRCGRGVYQGVTRDHWVEVDLGDEAPGDGPLWLVARGWVHPTDSSINFALEQGTHDAPRGLVLELPDGRGGWKVGRDRLGFPAGKNKTILVRLDGLDGAKPVRRFRLRTNMEIYWDALQYTRGRDDAPIARQRLSNNRADLHFRGIVAMTQANANSPELPDYDQLVSTGQYWRDLIGFHTRHGDVGELLAVIDDRYAILCGGDEIALRFAAPPGPPPGWRRDFVWVSDGWVKDGDYNTRWGKTVLPLPAHDLAGYDAPPGLLEDDPVFRRHARDWEVFHTRYVTPLAFERGLRNFHLPENDNTQSKHPASTTSPNDVSARRWAGGKP